MIDHYGSEASPPSHSELTVAFPVHISLSLLDKVLGFLINTWDTLSCYPVGANICAERRFSEENFIVHAKGFLSCKIGINLTLSSREFICFRQPYWQIIFRYNVSESYVELRSLLLQGCQGKLFYEDGTFSWKHGIYATYERPVIAWWNNRQVVQSPQLTSFSASDLAQLTIRGPAITSEILGRPSPTTTNDESTVLAIIPYYDCEEWLENALYSITKQSRLPNQIAVLCDGGDVPAFELRDKFPTVTFLVSSEHVGPYALAEAVIRSTHFEYYMFQDADDWSTIDRLECLLDEITFHRADLVGSQELRVEEDGRLGIAVYPLDVNLQMTKETRLEPNWLVDHLLLHPSSLVRRSAFLAVGGFSDAFRFGADSEFLYRVASHAKVRNSAKALYFRRNRSGSLTRSDTTGYGTAARKARIKEISSRVKLAGLSRQRVANYPPISKRCNRAILVYVCGPELTIDLNQELT